MYASIINFIFSGKTFDLGRWVIVPKAIDVGREVVIWAE